MLKDTALISCSSGVAACVLIGLFSSAVSQQKVYRCKTDEGTTIFSDVPCSDELEPEIVREAYSTDTPVARTSRVDGSDDGRADSASERERYGRDDDSEERHKNSEEFALLCESAHGLRWYRHDYCPEFIQVESDRRPVGVVAATGQVVIGVKKILL